MSSVTVVNSSIPVSGSVNILNSFKLNTSTYATIPAVGTTWYSDSADLRQYSLADIYMLSAGTVTSTLGMNFTTQYSPDGIIWFDSGNNLVITSSVPQGIAIGILSASPYVRLAYNGDAFPDDVATDVTLWIPSKAI